MGKIGHKRSTYMYIHKYIDIHIYRHIHIYIYVYMYIFIHRQQQEVAANMSRMRRGERVGNASTTDAPKT